MSEQSPRTSSSPPTPQSTTPSEPTSNDTTEPSEATRHARSTARLVSASALMAGGTLVSRLLGFGRLMLLTVLFGNGTRQAEMFTLANTVPNSMYILLAGGVLNTVLVPQIVRAIKGDKDRGEAYTNRIMTGGLIVLTLITVVLTAAVPLIIAIYSAHGWKDPALATQYQSMIMLGYYCMPQVFFYGVYVLAGQILNARDRFGPMMWAPIANNVVSIGVLLIFLFTFGEGDTASAFSSGEELLLGLGSTLGIAIQALVLLPFLRAAGYRFRPRFDFRHTGLGKTVRLAKWTLGFVLVTQLALVVVNRLASSATVGGSGAGLTAYANAYAVWILPHSLITVSLATAMLPSASRLAHAGDLKGVADETLRAVRLAVTALLPASVAFIALGVPIAQLAFGFGQGADDADFVGWALMALGFGLVPFTVQYLFLRTFYALEANRTTFFLQVLISGVNVVVAVLVVYGLHRSSLVATGLAAAYSLAYVVGVIGSYHWLRRRLPDLTAAPLVRLCVRLLVAAAPAGAVGFWITFAFSLWSTSQFARALGLATAGLVAVGIFLLLSRWLHIREVTDILQLLRRRRRSGSGDRADDGSGDPSDPEPSGDSADPEAFVGSTIDPGPQPTIDAEDVPVVAEGGLTAEVSSETAPTGTTETMVTQAGALSASEQDLSAGADDPGSSDAARTARVAGLPAGTVLGARYRLEELLAEAPTTVTWRAFDQVLSRSVLVHLLPPGQTNAPDLLDLARRASIATDARFLRVLDVVHVDDRAGDPRAGDPRSDEPDTGDYIVCEYANGQTLEAILTHGPLSGLEAAWIVRELADALAGIHSAALGHERINPDTVVITPTGNVRIVGLVIEKVLRPAANAPVHGHDLPEASTPELTDVRDLGRLLYACLVARWPGGPAFGLPEAPQSGHRWLTPRQVRAGVAPALDHICDQILSDPPRHRGEQLTTAVGVVNALTKVLGPADASNDLERRLRQPVPRVRSTVRFDDDRSPARPRHGGQAGAAASREAAAMAPPPAPAAVAPGQVTPEQGVPSSPESVRTTLIRQPIPPAAGRARKQLQARRSRTALLVLIVLLSMALVAAGLVAFLGYRQRASTAGSQPSSAASTAATPSVPVKLPISSARDFDPQGDPPEENPQETRLAVDGDLTTRWRTNRYLGNPKLGNLKRGVGLVVDLGQARSIDAVKVTLSGTGTNFDVRIPKNDPARVSSPPMTSDAQWQVVGKATKATGTTTVDLAAPVESRYLLVYLTSLPREGGGYRGGVYEIEVFS
ncbi:murein biosynthesis integral membrane protein MurJ [Microlunatus ginsengisoli]|uniref:Murein biosynthesis integral membrane protein MurJ n=1 Tax=Microlunatus ginsengisoli TaxID=363863 RepID=A0ABP6ZY06_9ACTN